MKEEEDDIFKEIIEQDNLNRQKEDDANKNRRLTMGCLGFDHFEQGSISPREKQLHKEYVAKKEREYKDSVEGVFARMDEIAKGVSDKDPYDEYMKKRENAVSPLKSMLANLEEKETESRQEKDVLFLLMAKALGLSDTGYLSKTEIKQHLSAFLEKQQRSTI